MSAKKQTSPRLSSSAARLLAKLPKRGRVEAVFAVRPWLLDSVKLCTVAQLRSLLHSLVSQDETRGQEPKKAKRRRGLR